MVHSTIDKLIDSINRLTKQFILAYTASKLGETALAGFADEICVETIVGISVVLEPIPMRELRSYQGGSAHFLLEVFHG
jgi:hypothetical protein